MGYLVFAARLHQIKRKKSNLNMRLMHVSNQKQRIAEQIANAEKAKTARQNLFNSTVRTTQNALQTIMGIGNSTSVFMNTQQAMNFGAATNRQWANMIGAVRTEPANIEGVGGIKTYFDANNAPPDLLTHLQSTGIIEQSESDNNKYYLTNGNTKESVNAAISNYFTQKQTEAFNQQMRAQMTASAAQMAMQGIVQAGNFFMDVNNQVQDFCDSTELEHLHNIDSQLEQEQTALQTQLKALDEEEKSVQQALDKGIKDSAPKFA